MTPRRRTLTFRIDDELLDGLQAVYARDGILQSEQLRRAIRTWLESKGVLKRKKSDRPRPPRRTRS